MTREAAVTISVEWDSPAKRWLVVTYPVRWQWSDIVPHKQVVDTTLNTVDYEVGVIGDLRASNFVIPNAIPNMSKAFATAPSHVGLVIVVGANRFFQVVVMMVRQILPNSPLRNLMFVSTMQEAITIMEARYPARDTADS